METPREREKLVCQEEDDNIQEVTSLLIKNIYQCQFMLLPTYLHVFVGA